jgi:hypothetical protein
VQGSNGDPRLAWRRHLIFPPSPDSASRVPGEPQGLVGMSKRKPCTSLWRHHTITRATERSRWSRFPAQKLWRQT